MAGLGDALALAFVRRERGFVRHPPTEDMVEGCHGAWQAATVSRLRGRAQGRTAVRPYGVALDSRGGFQTRPYINGRGGFQTRPYINGRGGGRLKTRLPVHTGRQSQVHGHRGGRWSGWGGRRSIWLAGAWTPGAGRSARVHQGGEYLAQSRTPQRVDVLIPTAVLHVMQAVLNTPVLAEQFKQLWSGALRGWLWIPWGGFQDPPPLDHTPFFSRVSAGGSPSSSGANPSAAPPAPSAVTRTR